MRRGVKCKVLAGVTSGTQKSLVSSSTFAIASCTAGSLGLPLSTLSDTKTVSWGWDFSHMCNPQMMSTTSAVSSRIAVATNYECMSFWGYVIRWEIRCHGTEKQGVPWKKRSFPSLRPYLKSSARIPASSCLNNETFWVHCGWIGIVSPRRS